MEIKITQQGVYDRILAHFPKEYYKQQGKVEQRARMCSGCINFTKLTLYCSKCNCQKAGDYAVTEGKFIKEKMLDLSYKCPLKYW